MEISSLPSLPFLLSTLLRIYLYIFARVKTARIRLREWEGGGRGGGETDRRCATSSAVGAPSVVFTTATSAARGRVGFNEATAEAADSPLEASAAPPLNKQVYTGIIMGGNKKNVDTQGNRIANI